MPRGGARAGAGRPKKPKLSTLLAMNGGVPIDPALKKKVATTIRRQGQHGTKEEQMALKEVWLEAYAQSGIMTAACRAANIDGTTVRGWEEHDELFVMKKHMAREIADDLIRAEIRRRGVDGVTKPVHYQGERVDYVTEYSDNLLMFLSKSRMPEFREKQSIEHSGTLTITDLVKKAAEEVANSSG